MNQKVYHYAHISSLRQIYGVNPDNNGEGLNPPSARHHIGQPVFDYAIFGLLEPLSNLWVSNPYFPNIWNELRKRIGPVLLEIQPEELSEAIYVADYAHMATNALNNFTKKTFSPGIKGIMDRVLYRQPEVPSMYIHSDKQEARLAYSDSRVPLGEYEGQHLIPEVIIAKPVPLEKIRIAREQPLLLERMTSLAREGYIYHGVDAYEAFDIFSKIPDLNIWLKHNYATIEGSDYSVGRRR